MSFTTFTHRFASLLNLQNNQIRWVIFSTGLAVNGAILFFPGTEAFTSTRFNAAPIYQPIAAANSSQTSPANVLQPDTNQFEKADRLAVVGNRDAATALYVEAMNHRIADQSQQ